MPDREAEGEVQEEVAPNSYIVEGPDGSYRRNRRDIIRLPPPSEMTSPSEAHCSDERPQGDASETIPPQRSDRPTQPPERFDPTW